VGVLFDVWTYHTRWAELKPIDFDLSHRVNPRDISMKGFTPLMKTREMTDTEPAHPTLSASDISTATSNLVALDSIAKTCADNHVKLLLILTPTSPPNLNSWRLNLARIHFSQAYPDVHLLDLSQPGAVPGLNFKTDFFDPGHPTYAGAAKVSATLAGYLAQTYGLADHRDDPKYAAWDRDAAVHDRYLRRKGATALYTQTTAASASKPETPTQ
jgi:hypothetical protein